MSAEPRNPVMGSDGRALHRNDHNSNRWHFRGSRLHPDQSRPELALSAESMELAIVWADFFKANVDLVTESLAFDPKGADRKKIVGIIAKNPGIARSQLFRQSRMAAKELDEAIDSLVQANLICAREERAGKTYKTFYYLLKDEEVEL